MEGSDGGEPDAASAVEAFLSGSLLPGNRLDLSVEQLSSPVPSAGAIWCCLGNAFDGESLGSGSPHGGATAPLDAFLRAASAVSGPSDGVVIPGDGAGGLRRVRHRLEVALLLAKPPPSDDPLSAVAACTLALDLAATGSEDRSLRKSFRTLCPLGPVLIPWPGLSRIASTEWTLQVNGETRQRTGLTGLQRGPAEVVSLLHESVGLGRGDLVLLGAPAGGGILQRGDSVVATWGLGPELTLVVR